MMFRNVFMLNKTSIGIMQNSQMYRSGSTDILYGGAIHFENSNSTLINLTFEYNTAHKGGAMHISCDTYEICKNIINNSLFENNVAIRQGGAINYNFRRPEFSNITYRYNQAAYGPNIASYPVRIIYSDMVDQSMVLTNAASGMAYHQTIRMSLIDYDNQTMNLVSNSQIKIVPITAGAILQGVDYSVLINGEANFDNLQFVYGPGQDNIEYKATCDLIDSDKVSYLSLPTDDSIDVSFRYCQPGEIIVDDRTCSECSAGTYSFTWNSTKCEICMDDAV